MLVQRTLSSQHCSQSGGFRARKASNRVSLRPSIKVAPPQCRATGTASTSVGTAPGAKYFSQDRRPVILFDGVCNLCNNGVNTALTWDKKQRLRFSALQSPAGRELLRRSGRDPDDISSIVLVKEDTSYIKSEAILRIAQLLEAPFPVLAQMGFPFPLFFRDAVYDQVANNRYLVFGKRNVCRMMDENARSRFVD